ncbi:DUF998 domain-containing protein [Deinococcus sp.]|uniref:DUF998 domain-containing protein n=1 Tax=Deinococcus sp. TaxID=47478 RepID=UPI0025E5AAEE|nr:DUF998 domain-containing protein [Deinococcus sp.]
MHSSTHRSGAKNLMPLRRGALAGMAAPTVFVSVFWLEGWLRPGYQPAGMFVSELSLGPRGWVQIASFVLTGGLILIFARALAVSRLGGSRVGPVLLGLIGASLMASGPFKTDPSALFTQVSTHGLIHGLFGAVVFALAPATCLVYVRPFRRGPAWQPLATWTLAAGLVLVVGIIVLKLSQQPGSQMYAWKGLIQRLVLVTFMAWLFAFAARLLHSLNTERASATLH